MRVLIGYDGGECGDKAIDGLRWAGLGDEGVEARVLTVAPDVGLPPDPAFAERSPALAWLVNDRRQAVLADAAAVAGRGAQRLAAMMPGWAVEPAAEAGSIHAVLTGEAERWPADLLVVGSHGRGVVGRLFHGSVAQMCVNNCRRNVRIARGGPSGKDAGAGVRILVADDGSPSAEAAVNAVAARRWPAGSQAYVVHVVELPLPSRPAELGPDAAALGVEVIEARREMLAYGRDLAQATADTLRDAGLVAEAVVVEGQPRYMINDLATRESIDCVFLGARGHGLLQRLLLGSVASGVAAGAPCSVEIVRPT